MTKTTYFCEYKILPDHNTRDACMTVFGGMTPDDDKAELQDIELLGRWACVGEARGFCIVKSDNTKTLQRWLNNWVTMADISVTPCLDDNEQRELLLGTKPPFNAKYDNVSSNALEGHGLYFIKYEFRDGCVSNGFDVFKNMSEEDDKADSGLCESFGRWHVPSGGYGYAVASSPSALDIYKWAHNWNPLCEVEIIPVTTDEETREIISSKPGFAEKRASLLKSMGVEHGPCFVNAKFTFKTDEFKRRFIDILNGEEGLKLTRNWPGCQLIECYDSQENPLEFTIRQKWDKQSSHESYLNMRKETGLFDTVMGMLSTELEVTHLNNLGL